MKIKKQIPNILSTARACMAVGLPYIFTNMSLPFILGYYIVGDLTDMIDGFLARHWKVQSKYGKFVDPIADKSFNGLALLLTGLLINKFMFITLALELLIAGITMNHVKKHPEAIKKSNINVSKIGKIKSGGLFVTIIMMLVAQMAPILPVIIASYVCLGITSLMQVKSFQTYMKQYKEKAHECEMIEPVKEEKDDKQEEIAKLKQAKELALELSDKQRTVTKEEKTPTEQVINNFDMNNTPYANTVNDDNITQSEDLGISRTLKQ